MHPLLRICSLLAVAALLLAAPAPLRADEGPAPEELVHVPADEMDVLLAADKQGIVLRYDEYARLLSAARERARTLAEQAPVDGALVSATGVVDATGKDSARIALTYEAQVLAQGPRSIEFPISGMAVESLAFELGSGTYEELAYRPRLRFEQPGPRRMRLSGSAVLAHKGPQTLLGVRLPPAAAMALRIRVPAGCEGVVAGEGAVASFRSPPDRPGEIRARPARDGSLRVVFAPVADAVDGPPVLDAETHSLHHLGDGIIASRSVLHVDVYRQPATRIGIGIAPEIAVRALEGQGVTSTSRSEDRRTLWVDLEKPMTGRVSLTLDTEIPFAAQPELALPAVRIVDAVRQVSRVAVRFDAQVKPEGVRVEGGRRIAIDEAAQRQGLLAFLVSSEQGGVIVDLEPRGLRLEADSSTYLNLAEAGRTLITTINYRVIEGTLFNLRPMFPPEYELTELTLGGSSAGFTRERRPDGTVEITLARGVPAGSELLLAATFEQARTDWVPDEGRVEVDLRVPSAGADREAGYVALGADAAFFVLEAGRKDLVAVGAAELTARGVNPAGLLYGYRLDGQTPSVRYEVERHQPLLDAQVVTSLSPQPRRLDVRATIVHTIRRAGVRHLDFLVPAWVDPGQVRVQASDLRTAAAVDGASAPEGYRLWRAHLSERRIGRHVLDLSWYRDLDREDWRVEPAADLGPDVLLEQVERFVVARRTDGLEVRVLTEGGGVRSLEAIELPPEATGDPLGLLEVYRVADAGRVGMEVKKHGGAAVLNAIATLVDLDTAVAREGVLRTRASVHLFNVDRQFLEVSLPSGSALIGAIVDGQPVKPLSAPGGLTLVPVPTARDARARTVVALTYETHLGAEVGGELVVNGPEFPGLEVLQTQHRVALDPDLEVRAVAGDFGTHQRDVTSGPGVWLLAVPRPARESAAPGAASSGPVSGYAAKPQSRVQTEGGEVGARDRIETDNEMPAEELFEESEGLMDAPFEGPANNGSIGVAGRRTDRRRNADASQPQSDPVEKPRGEPAPLPPSAPVPMSPAEPGLAGGAGGAPAGGGQAPGSDEPPATGGEVLVPSDPTAPPPARVGRGGRRKGLLSLDVPVILAPGGVVVTRLGSGGEIRLSLARRGSDETTYLLLGLGIVAMGLWLGRTGTWRARLGVLLGTGLLAGALAATFGSAAGVFTAALANGATLLAGLWLGLALLRRAPLLLGRTAAGLAALASAGVLAALAHADEPRPAPPVVKEPSRLFVPYDPANPDEVAAQDRVFLPLETYLRLFKAAHPEQDPEQVVLGRMVLVREVRYDLRAEGEQVVGTLRAVLAKRGEGTLLVALPLGGMAVSQAQLGGQPVRLLLDAKGVYRIALEAEGEASLELTFHLPLLPAPTGRVFSFSGLPFAGARLELDVPGFAGDVQVGGARGRTELARTARPDGATDTRATSWIGSAPKVDVHLLDPAPEALPDTVRTRAESRTVHSVRDSGTETQVDLVLHILQGKAPFVDLALADGLRVLLAQGPTVARWEVLSQPTPRLRVTFVAPAEGQVPLSVRVFLAAAGPERTESLPELAVLDTTGELGSTIVNVDPTLRLDLTASEGLFRIARPTAVEYQGADRAGVVVGAWRFAARPASLEASSRRVEERVEVSSLTRVVLGDDHVRTRLEATVRVDRAPVGELAFALPGEDEVREVESQGLRDWWLEGSAEERMLVLRYTSLRQGQIGVQVGMLRRLAGVRENVSIPRWALRGAQRDSGSLVLYALPDVDVRPGAVAGLTSIPLVRQQLPAPIVEGASVVQAYTYEAPIPASLLVGLGTPVVERRAVVITLVAPGDELHRLEHLVLFDVRRGITDRLAVFVPDGGHAARDEVRTRDLRERREERVVRAGPDGRDVPGTLYDLRLQSPRGGVIEVIVSQAWSPSQPVQVVAPEAAAETRWFTLVRTFLDGQVTVTTADPKPDPIEWADIPFVPSGVDQNSITRSYGGRRPFALDVQATRRGLKDQAQAIVLSAVADAVLGRDGQARVRLTYRVFNRSRQFLRLKLPDGAVLFGATSAGAPVKPLAGAGGTLLLPIPKVPLGGTGYEVSVLYRARAGRPLDEDGQLNLPLPEVVDVQVDRTVARLHLPEGYEYDFESRMTRTHAADVAADLAEVAVQEARDLLEIAERGTLAQRVVACDNGSALLEQAKALYVRAPSQGKKEQLAAQIAAVEKQWAACRIQVQSDLSEATRLSQSAALSQEEFGGNAAQFLALDDAQVDELAEAEGRAAQGRAVWRYNPTDKSKEEKAPTEEYQALKKQLAEELGQQRELSQRKNIASKMARVRGAGNKDAEDMLGISDNTAAGLAWLNERLSSEQDRNRQLGANWNRGPLQQGQTETADSQTFVGYMGQSGDVAQTLRSLENALNFDLHTRQGDGAADGARYRLGEAEVQLRSDLGILDGEGRARDSSAARHAVHGATGEPRMQAGLMGVDVPLPQLGRVVYFRGERSGGAIGIEASAQGLGMGARVVIFLLLLAAAGLATLAWRRRVMA